MAPRTRAPCQVCNEQESRYTCSKCMIIYCSVPCYRTHQERACKAGIVSGPAASSTLELGPSQPHIGEENESTIASQRPDLCSADSTETAPEPPLRPLTSLKWPYVPEEPSYPDPLKRNDPKPLQLHQYEAIATSKTVREALKSHPSLPALLSQIDSLRGQEREDALQQALGLSHRDDFGQSGSRDVYGHRFDSELFVKTDEERDALRVLAEAVESAVRGGKEGALGLDWEGEHI